MAIVYSNGRVERPVARAGASDGRKEEKDIMLSILPSLLRNISALDFSIRLVYSIGWRLGDEVEPSQTTKPMPHCR
jgi:hypothetical protein